MRISDWSSDVCSSDLLAPEGTPDDLDLPLGLLAFEVADVPDTGVVDFTVYLDSDIAVNGYWKQIDGQWVNMASSITEEGGKTKIDRKSGGSGKRVSVRVDLGGRRIIKKKKKQN